MEKGIRRLYQWLCGGRLSFLMSDRVKEDLRRLYPGELIGKRLEGFYVRKLKLAVYVLAAGLFLGIAAYAASTGGRFLKGDGSLERGDYREGRREVLLRTDALSGQTFELILHPVELPDEEKEPLAEAFLQEIDRYILGKNADRDHIYRDLSLKNSYEGVPFETTWESSRLDLMDEWGTVGIAVEPTEVILKVTLRWGEYQREAAVPITVIPIPKTEEEEAVQELEQYLLQAEAKSRGEAYLELPDRWQGQKLTWRQQVEDYSLLIWALTPAVAAALFLAADRDLHKELQERQANLKASYPRVVHRLMLYLGAGLSLRKAFERLAETYETGEDDPAGQELRLMARQLQAGIPEGTVYEHFGRRLGVQEYMRLSALLLQNQRRGNAALLDRLGQEAESLSREKLLNARKLGEETGTKLLLPMVLLLGCVMVMIMIPAFGVM